jgi:hypothetical protein
MIVPVGFSQLSYWYNSQPLKLKKKSIGMGFARTVYLYIFVIISVRHWMNPSLLSNHARFSDAEEEEEVEEEGFSQLKLLARGPETRDP